MDQHNAEVGIFITIEPITAGMRQAAQNMGSFEHNHQTYPRLQFWQIDDTYFENPDVINTLVRLPDAWRIRPTQKSDCGLLYTKHKSVDIKGFLGYNYRDSGGT